MRYLLRLSPDITIKSDTTRRRFMRLLCDNLRDALRSAGITARVENRWARIHLESEHPDAAKVAARVFGVHSISRVRAVPAPDLDTLVEAAAAEFAPAVPGRRFAVRARCAGKTTLHASAIERALGARLLPAAARVDLDHPEVTCHVEVRDGEAFLFKDSLPGARGLPLGSEGRAVALISGGFDSAVAAWLTMRRGVELSYVFCRLGGAVHTQATLRVLQILGQEWSAGSRPRVHIVPFEAVAEAIRAACRPSYWQLVLKRAMYRVGRAVAQRVHAHALVTGESLGQVSSQTFRNLTALDAGLDLTVLRPLLAFDKEEILTYARRLGTYEISRTVQEYCAMTPRKPVVATKRRALLDEESRVDLDVEALLAATQVLEVRRIGPEDLHLEGLEVDSIPDDAVVLDLRSKRAYESWHYPDALWMELGAALAHLDAFDAGKRYVLYCEIGLKSAHLAEEMQKRGLQAWNLRGGMRRVVELGVERGALPAAALDDPALLTL